LTQVIKTGQASSVFVKALLLKCHDLQELGPNWVLLAPEQMATLPLPVSRSVQFPGACRPHAGS
jgi:hypothetical protein